MGPALFQEDLPWDVHNCSTPSLDRRAHGDLKHPRQLFRIADQLAIDRGLAEDVLGMGLLKVGPTDFSRRNLRCDREHRNTAAGRVVKAIDQVNASRPATADANGQFPRERSFSSGRKSRRLLMAHVLPDDRAIAAESIGETIERIPWNSIDSLNRGILQNTKQNIRDCRHC